MVDQRRMTATSRNAWRQVSHAALLGAVLALALPTSSATTPTDVGHLPFLSPHAAPIAASGDRIFVVNTPAGTLDIIDAGTRSVAARIAVGVDPVSVAIRPDGKEVWVSNHISDSVSVIDTDPASPTHLQIVATIQDFDSATNATRFDEPVGIAFASNDKAYVALSAENKIAVVDVNTRSITRRRTIDAQDPRAITVRGNRLYVIPFESNNKTQLSGCVGPLVGELCTFDATEHVVDNNNVLSQFAVVDIVKHPQVPDRDLYVYDTADEALIEIIDTVGTLLYGLAVDSTGQVFVAQADARNDSNGKAGTAGDGLAEMENRAFLNQITRIDCSGERCAAPQFIDLEPRPPEHPDPALALATPFAIQVSADDSTLVASAAGSNQLFTVDAASGAVLGRAEVGAVPRGIALESDAEGKPKLAWVLNAVANTVSVVDLSNREQPKLSASIALDDPTPAVIKRGRAAFNDARASTTGTFSCASCHPDGHTDQLIWVLDTPICDVAGCDQIPPRITMPIRGLRDTAPYHWDGIPGDPYGGSNTANIFGNDAPNCELNDPVSCTRALTDGALGSTMCQVGNCASNDVDQAGALSDAERDDMAQFLLAVPYPPAQRRSYSNRLTDTARTGFRLFHIDGDLQDGPQPNVCGNCHRMPFLVSTNTPGTGMEAPTWRGAYDRWLILPQGRVNIIDFDFFRSLATVGTPERDVWRLSWSNRPRFDPVWNMVTEGSTGFSGAFARQVTLTQSAANRSDTGELLDALETAAADGGVALQVDGAFVAGDEATAAALRFDRGRYVTRAEPAQSYSRAELISAATAGEFVGTFTGRAGAKADVNHPQPALWTLGPMQRQRGPQQFPSLTAASTTMQVSGRHVRAGAHLIVDGERVTGNVRCQNGELPDCVNETLTVQLAKLPPSAGMHFLQLQNPDGLHSNDFIFNTTVAGGEAAELDLSGPWFNAEQSGHGWFLEHIAAADPKDPDTLNAYWYVYDAGEPVWLTGQGQLIEGRAVLDMFITTGAQFPPEFDPSTVSLLPWGTIAFEFVDNRSGSVFWRSGLDEFGSEGLNISRLGEISKEPEACHSGSYYRPDQSGHGFVSQIVDVNGAPELLLTWYTYLDGEQVWLLGQAPLGEETTDVPMRSYRGATFPPQFVSGAVVSEEWGTVSVAFPEADSANVSWNAISPDYGSGSLELNRLTLLSGHACQ